MNYIWIIIIALYIVLTHMVAKHIGAKREIGYGNSVFWSISIKPNNRIYYNNIKQTDC